MIQIGRHYFFICSRFFYWGRVAGWSDDSIFLTDAYIIYETGPWKDDQWQTMEKLPCDWAVSRGAVESYGEGKPALWQGVSVPGSAGSTT